MRRHMTRCLTAGAALALASTVAAQVQPDAGRTLQQQQQIPPEPPRATPALNIQTMPATAPQPGGPVVQLRALRFEGNTRLDAQALQAVVADAIGRTLDMAQLWALAERLSAHYREAGYPFARAVLPPQQLQDGTLRIQIVEGRFGDLRTRGDTPLAAAAQPFLGSLRSGDVIQGTALERAVLLLDDLPGIRTTPVMRPGSQPGTGDLDVLVDALPPLQGSVSLDNHGNRYTGTVQLRLDARVSSPFRLGDQIRMQAMVSDRQMLSGRAGYSLPVGHDGLRAQVELAHTHYELGREFSNLGAHGTARTASAGLAYALHRTQAANLTLDASLVHKRLHDAERTAGTTRDKRSLTLPLTARFDLRDEAWGPAVSYGTLVLTAGRLNLDSTLQISDGNTARTAGRFHKLNLDLARVQALPVGGALYGRLAAQWADKNLDSSEGFGPGGPNGVRAYPSGEAYGNAGWLLQAEWRGQIGPVSPYVFYDASHTRTNVRPWTPTANSRGLGGVGVGVRGQVQALMLDLSVAARTQGGASTSAPGAGRLRGWLTATLPF